MSSQQYISDDQIAQAGITREIATTMEEAWNFEQSTWATGSVASDEFYIVPSTGLSAAPGTHLKAEEASDTAKFTLPPSTALSRILFQTRTLEGKAVPASAFVLWPYNPHRQPDGTIPVVSWAHGTSGLFGDQGPSHLKALSYQFGAPYTLALQGYVVVGADYAGLGANYTARTETVHHEFLANPAHANDLFYSVQAAQAAFPQLSKQFVIMGHSQGGGAAWAAAQRQAVHPVPGYLGAVAASPVTNLFKLPPKGPLFSILTTFVLYALQSLYPEFDYRDILTEQAAKRWELYLQLKAGVGVAFSLLLGIDLLKPEYAQNPYLRDFVSRTSNGGKAIAGPLLVLQGLADVNIDAATTTQAVCTTCKAFPGSAVQYQTWEGVTHNPIIFAAQQTWLQWIEDRFMGRPVVPGCRRSKQSPFLPPMRYKEDANWIIEQETDLYKLAMP
ncbi:MAG: hypothetical protein L6R35_006753 [Caloplaca aegaea]|nr:MAG: hypothetical protein L6R35_006753 [Caloplaca aegaea]